MPPLNQTMSFVPNVMRRRRGLRSLIVPYVYLLRGFCQPSSPLKLRPLVVADRWIIRSQRVDEFYFLLSHLSLGSGLGLPENLFCDGEAASLFQGEILSNQVTVRATEIVDAVRPILTHVNLPIGVGNLVNDVHRLIPIPSVKRQLPSTCSLNRRRTGPEAPWLAVR